MQTFIFASILLGGLLGGLLNPCLLFSDFGSVSKHPDWPIGPKKATHSARTIPKPLILLDRPPDRTDQAPAASIPNQRHKQPLTRHRFFVDRVIVSLFVPNRAAIRIDVQVYPGIPKTAQRTPRYKE